MRTNQGHLDTNDYRLDTNETTTLKKRILTNKQNHLPMLAFSILLSQTKKQTLETLIKVND